MIRHTGSPETDHFVNWVLNSGYVDALALADKAVSEAMSEDGAQDDLGHRMRWKLAKMLEEAIPVGQKNCAQLQSCRGMGVWRLPGILPRGRSPLSFRPAAGQRD